MRKTDKPEDVAVTANPAETRQRILLAAARMFRYKGFAGTSLREIAKETGIKAGSIYYHFDSKDQILDEVLDQGIQNVADLVRERVDALPATATWLDRITAAIEGHLWGALQQGDFTSANIRLWAQLPQDTKERHVTVRRAYSEYWDRLFEGAHAAGELREGLNPRVVRLFVVGALNWTVEWHDPARGTFESFCEQILNIVFGGIARQSPSGPAGR